MVQDGVDVVENIPFGYLPLGRTASALAWLGFVPVIGADAIRPYPAVMLLELRQRPIGDVFDALAAEITVEGQALGSYCCTCKM